MTSSEADRRRTLTIANDQGSQLALLLSASTLTVLAGALLSPVMAQMRSDLDISGTAAGLILTAHGLTLALVGPAVGRLIDRIGTRDILVSGLLVYGLAGGVGLVTTSYLALLASRLVFGIGAAAVFTGTTVALLAVPSGLRRDRAIGWRGAALSIGGVAWPLLGGALGTVSWQAPFAIHLVAIPLAVVALRVVPSGRPAEARQAATSIVALLQHRQVLVGYYALFAIGSILMYAVLVFLPLQLTELGVESPLLIAVYTTSMSAAMSLTGLAYARLRRRLGYRTLLRATYGMFLLGFVLLGTLNHSALVALAPVLIGLGMGVSIPALTVMTNDTAPTAQRGQLIALVATATFLGQFSAPLLLGPLVDATTPATGFLAAAGLAAVVLISLSRTAPSDKAATTLGAQ